MKGTPLLASMVLGLVACGVAWAQDAVSADSDVTPPTVTRTAPVSGVTCVDPAANVSAFFSEDMKASSVNDTTVRLYRKGSTTQVPSSVRYGAQRVRAVIDPMEPLEGGVTYRAVVGVRVEDLAGNRLDQDSATTGLQPKVWAFKTSTSSESVLDCQQAAAQTALRNAVAAATSCAANHNGSYTECATATQLQPYGFEPTAGVAINGINGNAYDWSAAMQHSRDGSAYTFATFGDNAGKIVPASRGTGAPALPDKMAEWEAMAQADTRNAAQAANSYAADNGGAYYGGVTMAGLVSEGFVQSPNVTTTIVETTPNYVVIESEHAFGGRAYQYDSRNGQFGFVPR